VGYKRLQQFFDLQLGRGDCLLVDPLFDRLASRRYLGFPDGIKEYYLGKNYSKRYPECDAAVLTSPAGRMYYLTDREVSVDEKPEVITDQLGNRRFFIYRYQNPLVI
jgi:hypothetical protein